MARAGTVPARFPHQDRVLLGPARVSHTALARISKLSERAPLSTGGRETLVRRHTESCVGELPAVRHGAHATAQSETPLRTPHTCLLRARGPEETAVISSVDAGRADASGLDKRRSEPTLLDAQFGDGPETRLRRRTFWEGDLWA
eukprot:6211519-Pleurochrysis_carterae.AAC.2